MHLKVTPALHHHIPAKSPCSCPLRVAHTCSGPVQAAVTLHCPLGSQLLGRVPRQTARAPSWAALTVGPPVGAAAQQSPADISAQQRQRRCRICEPTGTRSSHQLRSAGMHCHRYAHDATHDVLHAGRNAGTSAADAQCGCSQQHLWLQVGLQFTKTTCKTALSPSIYLPKGTQVCDGLYGLAQPHFVRQNNVIFDLGLVVQPVEPFKLVGVQLTT